MATPDRAAELAAVQQVVAANGAGRDALTSNLVAQVAAILQGFTAWYDEVAVKRLTKQIGDLVAATQRVTASQEDAYLARVSTTLAGRPFSPVGPVNVTDLRNAAIDSVYERLAVQYRYERSIGTADEQAIAKVLNRADAMNQTDAQLAARAQWVRFFTENKITGYRRVIHPELSKGGTCGLCIAATDRIYKGARLMPIHDRCCCGVMPIIGGFDAGDSLNNLDLGQLYSDAGTTSAAALKRTRYKVLDHGELGPVLAPKGATRPDYIAA